VSEYKFEFKMVKVNDLALSPNNPRKSSMPTEEEIEEMVNNIEKVGLLEPIVVNHKNEILSGQLRWICADKLGWEEIPCIVYNTEEISRDKGLPIDVVETIIGMSSDVFKHKLNAEDKFKSVQKIKNLLKCTQEEIGSILGISQKTVSRWLGHGEIPRSLEKQESIEQFLKLSTEKRREVKSILRSPSISKDDVLRSKVIHFGTLAKLRDVRQAKQDVSSGINVDWDFRTKLIRDRKPLVLLRIRMPKILYDEFLHISRKKGKDTMKIIIELIQWYVEHGHLQTLGY